MRYRGRLQEARNRAMRPIEGAIYDPWPGQGGHLQLRPTRIGRRRDMKPVGSRGEADHDGWRVRA